MVRKIDHCSAGKKTKYPSNSICMFGVRVQISEFDSFQSERSRLRNQFRVWKKPGMLHYSRNPPCFTLNRPTYIIFFSFFLHQLLFSICPAEKWSTSPDNANHGIMGNADHSPFGGTARPYDVHGIIYNWPAHP